MAFIVINRLFSLCYFLFVNLCWKSVQHILINVRHYHFIKHSDYDHYSTSLLYLFKRKLDFCCIKQLKSYHADKYILTQGQRLFFESHRVLQYAMPKPSKPNCKISFLFISLSSPTNRNNIF